MNSAISLERVSKTFKGRQVLRDVSLKVEPGDIFGYLGPNGAGKTTTIRIVLGLLPATSGEATVMGEPVSTDGTRKRLGFVLETDGLYDNMTARDNIGFFMRIYGEPASSGTIERALNMAGLAERAGDKVGTFSKGMRQRLVLARAMVHNPEILILDEPTAGVDPSGQIEVREIILDLARRERKTIFLSSHNLDEVQRICNRIALISQGALRLSGELSRLQREMGGGEVEIETVEPIGKEVLDQLKGLPEVKIRSQQDSTVVLSLGRDAAVPDIVGFLTARQVRIEQVKRREASLEKIYTTILKEAEAPQP